MLILTHPMPFVDAAPPWTPASVTGLKAWWAADTLVLADGAKVASWADKLGAYTLTQANSTKQPLYRASGGPGNKPYVDFNAVTLALATAMTGTPPWTWFFVMNYNATSYQSGPRIWENDNANTALETRFRSTGGSGLGMFINVSTQGPVYNPATQPPIQTWYIYTCRYAAANAHLRYNETAYRTSATDMSAFTPASCVVGSTTAAGSSSGSLTLFAEMLLYEGAVSDADETLIVDYLNAKYTVF